MAKNNQYIYTRTIKPAVTLFIFCPFYFMHLCCDKQVIKWLPKPIHVSSGLFYYNSVQFQSWLVPSRLSIARDSFSWGKMSPFSRSVWISLTLNNALNYSQKFYTDKSDNNDFNLHGVWTGPVGKIWNSGNMKFLKIHINPTSTV